jgi:hypothetical protein
MFFARLKKATHDFKYTQRWMSDAHPASKVNVPATSGFFSFLRQDYMGAAEFEWGAIPCALRLTRKLHRSRKYQIHEIRHPDFQTSIWIALLPGHDKEAIQKDLFAIIDESKEAPYVKEHLYLLEALKQRQPGVEVTHWVNDTWCTVPRYSTSERPKEDPEFYPVWMSLYKETLDKVLAEALLPSPA